MKRIMIFLLFAIGIMFQIQAQTFRVNNLKFTVTNSAKHTVEAAGVTQNGQGELKIPERVQYNGVTYTVTSIGYQAFLGGCGYSSLTLPSTLESIGDEAFIYCRNYTGKLVIPNSVKSIGEGAFAQCKGFTSLSLPNSLTTINPSTFSGCAGLTGTLVIPNSVVEIGYSSFINCSGLSSVTISNKAEFIGARAFWMCNLKGELVIPNSVKTIYDQAFSGNKITSLKLSDSLKEIGAEAFNDCTSLTGVLIIPKSVTKIGESAFTNSAITGIEFKSSPELGKFAFSYCRRLQEIKCYTNQPPKSGGNYGLSYIFEGCPHFTIAVPQGCLNNYQSSIWGKFNRDIFDDLKSTDATPLIANGIYYIYPASSDKFRLDNMGNIAHNGNNVGLWELTDANAQKWKVENYNNGIVLRSMCDTNFVLDNDANTPKDKNNVQIWEFNGCNAQIWIPQEVSKDTYILRNAENEKFVLDLPGGELKNGNNIEIFTDWGNENQKWHFVKTY